MALSVATSTLSLDKHPVLQPRPVLVHLAEDALVAVPDRIGGIARYPGPNLGPVEVHLITTAVPRLDQECDRMRL
jgi:hypothetical protein